jgi:hypothetical protein
MTTQQSLDCQIQPLERAMLAECFEGILRAGGGKSATWLFEWRDADLIKSYKKYERKNGNLSEGCQ